MAALNALVLTTWPFKATPDLGETRTQTCIATKPTAYRVWDLQKLGRLIAAVLGIFTVALCWKNGPQEIANGGLVAVMQTAGHQVERKSWVKKLGEGAEEVG